ncbi:MAG: hypothetical protein PHD61_09660 [Bacteroidales bacterium]|nr:hypothetical protein [Lentimicrobiaceae bacterium]MDD5695552.1 hypothetical protein [Bacteroidales bacterium]
MKRLLILSVVMIFTFASCEVAVEEVAVTYLITDSDSGFDVRYRDSRGELISVQVKTQSESDVWRYTFGTNPGEIVFVSANYYDINSKIKVRILLDGKIFREASSLYDTSNFVVVSGTVPY